MNIKLSLIVAIAITSLNAEVLVKTSGCCKIRV